MSTVQSNTNFNLNTNPFDFGALDVVKGLAEEAKDIAVSGVKALGQAINNNRVISAGVAVAGLAFAANAYSAEIAEAGVQFLRDNVDVNGTLGDFINRNIVEYAPEQPGVLASIGNAIAGVFGY